ncbi:hypothetical protein V8C86DRAFT_3128329 [Haematococcus lacustris]
MDRARRRSPPRRVDRGRGPPSYDGPPDRRRSRSPPDRYGRGVSPQYRRRREDFDRYKDEGPGGYNGRPAPRGSPRYDDYDDAGRRSPVPDRPLPAGPQTFKAFLLSQDDDPDPEEAQTRYKAYLVEYHGGEVKAEFAETRNSERVRALYDPRSFEKALTKRNEEAAESLTRFADDVASGALDPTSLNFNQGAYELAPKPMPADSDDGGKGVCAPPVCWKPARIARDIALTRALIRRLDHEKGLPATNPLLPPSEEATAALESAAEHNAQQAADAKESGKDAPTGGAKRCAEVVEALPVVDASNYSHSVGQLDMQLTYLWRVHGVDFYAGYELAASEFGQRLTACRLLRGAKPKGLDAQMAAAAAAGPAGMAVEGEAAAGGQGTGEEAGGEGAGEGVKATRSGSGSEEAAEQEAAAVAVDEFWSKRIQEGDPLEAKCQRSKVAAGIDAWVDAQVVCHAPDKWGNLLSTKLFKARQFVVKHIRSKHEEKLQAEKDRIMDELYWENFKAAKEAEAKAAEAAARAARGEDGADGEGGRGGRGGRGVRGGRLGERGGGRGGRGPGRGVVGPGGPMPMMPGLAGMMMPGMDPMAFMNQMGPMGMAPLILPPAMNPFMGLPFMSMMNPAMMNPAMMMAAAGRGARGGRGMGPMTGTGRGGGRAGRGMGGDRREYYDLDNPSNNRAVLDYGDL